MIGHQGHGEGMYDPHVLLQEGEEEVRNGRELVWY